MVKENKTEAIFLLLVEGIQMRVAIQVIHMFKALGFLWLNLS